MEISPWHISCSYYLQHWPSYYPADYYSSFRDIPVLIWLLLLLFHMISQSIPPIKKGPGIPRPRKICTITTVAISQQLRLSPCRLGDVGSPPALPAATLIVCIVDLIFQHRNISKQPLRHRSAHSAGILDDRQQLIEQVPYCHQKPEKRARRNP